MSEYMTEFLQEFNTPISIAPRDTILIQLARNNIMREPETIFLFDSIIVSVQSQKITTAKLIENYLRVLASPKTMQMEADPVIFVFSHFNDFADIAVPDPRQAQSAKDDMKHLIEKMHGNSLLEAFKPE